MSTYYIMTSLTLLTQKDVPLFSFDGLTTAGKIVRIVDGDTVHVIIQFNGQVVRLVCRLNGIDTPEMSKTPEKAKIARNRLTQLCTNCCVDLHDMSDSRTFNAIIDTNTKLINIEFLGKEKYGRELVKIYDDNATCINDTLIAEGCARVYDGGTKQSWS